MICAAAIGCKAMGSIGVPRPVCQPPGKGAVIAIRCTCIHRKGCRHRLLLSRGTASPSGKRQVSRGGQYGADAGYLTVLVMALIFLGNKMCIRDRASPVPLVMA